MPDKWAPLSLTLLLAACESSPPAPTVDAALDVVADAAVDAPAEDLPRVVVRPDTHVVCRRRNPLREPFFGDLHVHTGLSFDAATWGTRARPADAYRFARGEAVGLAPYDADGHATRTTQLTRPLDFAAVTDHSEFLAETELCTTPGSPVYDSRTCRDQRETSFVAALDYALPLSSTTPLRPAICRDNEATCASELQTVWGEVQQAAEDAYDRTDDCRFTTFVGYEWTGSPGANNLHRNVIFRTATVPRSPTSYIEASTPDQLWAALDRDCLATGTPCDLVTIPHNSNQSAGLMFMTTTEDGRPYDAAFAARRARLEPLVEVYQHKGSSECIVGAASLLASEDEACGFEQLTSHPCVAPNDPPGCTPLCSVAGGLGLAGSCVEPNDFVRPALRRGLAEYLRTGADPFHMGFIAGTDTHNATPGNVDEDNWPGHAARGDDTPEGRLTPEGMGRPITIRLNSPGGLAVLWAEENSRDSLFSAMRRREAYATSGTRLVVRFFGGWALPDALCDASDLATQGYALGVPMGSDLPARPAGGGAPGFVVSALRDAMGSPLQRVEIVKGWADAGGTHERVFRIDGDATGATVDPATCLPGGTPGAAARCGLWRDPDFDPAAPAFWYARVLEDPTCRWSRRLCNSLHVDCAHLPAGSTLVACCDGSLPDTIQERAWTSPIWYLPPR